jgi:hypothetical protein
MKRFMFVPIIGYVDNETTMVFTSMELGDNGFTPQDIMRILGLTFTGGSQYIWDGSCGCTMVRIADGAGMDPAFDLIDNNNGETKRITLELLLGANIHDEELCKWLIEADVGDQESYAQGSLTLERVE